MKGDTTKLNPGAFHRNCDRKIRIAHGETNPARREIKGVAMRRIGIVRRIERHEMETWFGTNRTGCGWRDCDLVDDAAATGKSKGWALSGRADVRSNERQCC